MRHSKGPGGRSVDTRILRELENIGPHPVTANELASALATPARSIAPALQALVRAGLAERQWGDPRSPRMYALTDAGREYLTRQGGVVPDVR